MADFPSTISVANVAEVFSSVVEKKIAASPILEDPVIPERYDPYYKVLNKLHPERTEADKKALIESLRPVVQKENYVKDAAYYKKSILPDYNKPVEDQPSYYDLNTVDYGDV